MRKLVWLLGPCAAFLLTACDVSETVAPVGVAPERTMVIAPNASQATLPQHTLDPAIGTPQVVIPGAEAARRTANAKARIEELKSRGRPRRQSLRDRD